MANGLYSAQMVQNDSAVRPPLIDQLGFLYATPAS